MGNRKILTAVGVLLFIIAALLVVGCTRAQGTADVGELQRGERTRLGLDFAMPPTSVVSESDIEAGMEALRRRFVGLGVKDGWWGAVMCPEKLFTSRFHFRPISATQRSYSLRTPSWR